MKKILLVFAVLVYHVLYAQDTPSFNLTYNHNALSVKYVNRSAVFYKNVLQLSEITNRTQMEGIRWFSLGEGKELHLVSVLKEPVIINKAVHFALNTNNIDALVKRLNDQEIAYSDWPGTPNTVTTRADGVKQIYFQDPDGYWIEVNDANAATSVEAVKNEIWQKESDYWKYVKEKDIQSYVSLWDDNFLGYPSNNTVGNKAHITDWLTEMYKENIGDYNYELTRKVENVFGDIVIAFYDVAQQWTNKKGAIIKKSNIKIIHTWKKTDKGWLIIGGMGAIK